MKHCVLCYILTVHRDCGQLFIYSKFRDTIESFKRKVHDRSWPGPQESRILILLDAELDVDIFLEFLDTYLARLRNIPSSRPTPPFPQIVFACYGAKGASALPHTLSECHQIEDLLYIDDECCTDNGLEIRFDTTTNHVYARPTSSSSSSPNLECLASASSRLDMQSRLRHICLHHTARKHKCDTIFFLDNATRTAATVLSLSAQGRGSAVPWEVGGFTRLWNGRVHRHCNFVLILIGIWTCRPMKDLVDSEIQLYRKLKNVSPLTPSTRISATIDDLTVQYFSDLSTSFSSIVATVGKTSEKLKPSNATDYCLICQTPARLNAATWLDDVTVSTPAPDPNDDDTTTKPPLTSDPHSSFDQDITAEICYGCLVSLRGMHGSFTWPIIPSLNA